MGSGVVARGEKEEVKGRKDRGCEKEQGPEGRGRTPGGVKGGFG